MIKKAAAEIQAVAPEIATEQILEKDRCKLTYGSFDKRQEALTTLSEVKKKGYNAVLTIEGSYYKIFFGEFDKSTGDKVLADIKKKGFDAELI